MMIRDICYPMEYTHLHTDIRWFWDNKDLPVWDNKDLPVWDNKDLPAWDNKDLPACVSN